MPSTQLRPLIAFTDAFYTGSYSASVLDFLVPRLTPALARYYRTRTRQYTRKPRQIPFRKLSDDSKHARRVEASTQSPPKPSTKDEWVELLDPYLPAELRSKSWIENLAAFEGVRSIHDMPMLLQKASSAFAAHGLLSHLVLIRGRLEAFLWLVKALLESKQEAKTSPRTVQSTSPWQFKGNIPFDALTSYPIRPESILPGPYDSDEPFRSFSESDSRNRISHSPDSYSRFSGSAMSSTEFKNALGHVWECLGHMVLEAAGKDQEEEMKLMSYVYQVIAWMHTKDVVSPLIYQYDSDDIPAPVRKSPLLHLTSARIMATASESMWKVNERNIIGDEAIITAAHTLRDQQLSEADFVQHVRPLGPEIWLEFILWSCLHDNYLTEAAKLILHASRAKGRAGSRGWKAIGWQDIQEAVSKMSKDSDKQRARSWFARIASAIEGYSEERPLVSLPEYTISKEVVAVVLDGLLGAASGVDQEHASGLKLWPCAEACKAVLGKRDDSEFDLLFWNSILIRYFDMTVGFADPKLTAMMQAVQLAQRCHKASMALREKASQNVTSQLALQQSSPINSVMVRVLDEYIQQKDVDGALRVFQKLQHMIETGFGMGSKDDLDEGRDRDLDIVRDVKGRTSVFGKLVKFIPIRTLAALIDLLTAAKRYDVCRSILSSTDNDIILIPSKALESPVLQPALMRYATAAPDLDVLSAVTRKLYKNRNEPDQKALQALLHGQIAVGKWKNSLDLLGYLSARSRDLVGPKETMIVAGTVLLAEATDPTTGASPHPSRGREVLDLIMSGSYLARPNPSQLPDYTPYRHLAQTWRILSSAPGRLAVPLPFWITQNTKMQAPIAIDAEAFNTFLEALIEVYGVHLGKMMFDKWCLEPKGVRGKFDEEGGYVIMKKSYDEEKVVEPDLRTIQIILSPALADLSRYRRSIETMARKGELEEVDSRKHEDELLLSWESWTPGEAEGRSILNLPPGAPHRKLFQWGEIMYRAFELDDIAIYEAMPEACSKPFGYGRVKPRTKVFSVGSSARVVKGNRGLALV